MCSVLYCLMHSGCGWGGWGDGVVGWSGKCAVRVQWFVMCVCVCGVHGTVDSSIVSVLAVHAIVVVGPCPCR